MIKIIEADGLENILPLIDGCRQENGGMPMTAADLDELTKAVKREQTVVFAAYAKDLDTPIGMCTLSIFYSAQRGAYCAMFGDFYVQPDQRGKGIGGELVQSVFSYCRKNDIASIWVGASTNNVEMFERLGFDVPMGDLLCHNVK